MHKIIDEKMHNQIFFDNKLRKRAWYNIVMDGNVMADKRTGEVTATETAHKLTGRRWARGDIKRKF